VGANLLAKAVLQLTAHGPVFVGASLLAKAVLQADAHLTQEHRCYSACADQP
jgi:hypothetical protein